MKKRFKDFNFRSTTLAVIRQANQIITEYQSDGYDLTLRQLYYQFVARDIIANKQSEYNKLGTAVNNGRLAGLIDWGAIKDRTRRMQENYHEINPEKAIKYTADCYAIDTRQDQDVYLEAWVEKEALAGVVERACREIDIPWFACRGYISQSAAYEAAMRCRRRKQGRVVILHLGDHDPSGVDMTRDNQERFNMFGVDVSIKRIALNMDQVEQYNPPPNPAKLTDSRCGGYIAKYGDKSWELDALDPKTLNALIVDTAEQYTDKDKQDAMVARQEIEKNLIERASERWDDIVYMLEED